MPFRELPGATLCTFQKGERLISAGDDVQAVYYLTSGVVDCIMTRATGNETIFSRKEGGQGVSSFIGIFALYSEERPYITANDFVARTDCVCYRIPWDTCLTYFREHPLMMESLLKDVWREYLFMADKFFVKKEKTAAAQLCGFILHYSRDVNGERILAKNYTNVEIAKFISVHQVTVANILRALKEQACVERSKNGLLLKNVPLIQDYAEQKKILDYHN